MSNKVKNDIANTIYNFMYEYCYFDVYEDKAAALAETMDFISTEDGRRSLIDYFIPYLDDNETMKQAADIIFRLAAA